MQKKTKKGGGWTVFFLIVGVLILGAAGGFEYYRSIMIKKFLSHMKFPPAHVAVTKASEQDVVSKIHLIGNVVAMQNTPLTASLSGAVVQINFKSGQMVHEGDVLVQIDDRSEKSQLEANEAEAVLAELDFQRAQSLVKSGALSKDKFDAAQARLKNTQAMVNLEKSLIAKKTIVAPFDGRIGIRDVNLGQFVMTGQTVAYLQSVDPIYIDFTVPARYLPKITVGGSVEASVDSFAGKVFLGTVQAIDSKVDQGTRNMTVRARFPNPNGDLVPGMFARMTLPVGLPESEIVLPQPAIVYSSYGEMVYVLTPEKDAKEIKGQKVYKAQQKFVTLGEAVGSNGIVVKGLEVGDVVVVAGQLKIHNGSSVVISDDSSSIMKINPSYEEG